MTLEVMGQQALEASYQLATLDTAVKNRALAALADALGSEQAAILAANQQDIAAARDNGLSEALIDRLLLTEERLAAMAADVRSLCQLTDPVGEELGARVLENGLRLSKRRVPIGVLGVIYEARPNVTIDIAALALKTGNAAILRGGKETLHSNLALVKVIAGVLRQCDISADAIQYIDNPDRALVSELLKLDQFVDMIVPRGGAGLHRLCIEQSTIPVITGGIGICHLYVDASADLDKSVAIVENAKVQRPSVCNALDVLLVNRRVANQLLPRLAVRLNASAVTLRVTQEVHELLAAAQIDCRYELAGEDDFDQEWLSLTLSVALVDDTDAAIRHIRRHSSQHSDGILTESLTEANRFVERVNSAAVYVNASTRFTDGSQFGLGAEVAVSTQKLHARGPMGLEELTTYKWIGVGDYLIRQ